MNEHRVARYLAQFRLRKQRGTSLLDFVRDFVQGAAYFSIIKLTFDKYLGFDISFVYLVVLLPFYFLLQYIIGYADEKKGFWKFENKYSSRELNPQVAKLDDIEQELEQIKEKL